MARHGIAWEVVLRGRRRHGSDDLRGPPLPSLQRRGARRATGLSVAGPGVLGGKFGEIHGTWEKLHGFFLVFKVFNTRNVYYRWFIYRDLCNSGDVDQGKLMEIEIPISVMASLSWRPRFENEEQA